MNEKGGARRRLFYCGAASVLWLDLRTVMAGLVPAIHVFSFGSQGKARIARHEAGMTN
jgi:hypothetical protein